MKKSTALKGLRLIESKIKGINSGLVNYLEYIQTLGGRSTSPCLRCSSSVRTSGSAECTFGGDDTPLSQLLQYRGSNGLSGTVTLITFRTAIGVAGTHRCVRWHAWLRWNSPGQGAVTLVRRYTGARLGIVTAFAAAHVAAAASVRCCAHASV